MCGTYNNNPTVLDIRRAKRGAEILDREFPGWEHQINLMTLEIRSSQRCVLAQVGRHHKKTMTDMVEVLFDRLQFLTLRDHGFAIDAQDAWDWEAAEVRMRRAWTAEITYRQSRPKAKVVIKPVVAVPVESQKDYELTA